MRLPSSFSRERDLAGLMSPSEEIMAFGGLCGRKTRANKELERHRIMYAGAFLDPGFPAQQQTLCLRLGG